MPALLFPAPFRAGNIKLWRIGVCETTFSGGCTNALYFGIPVAVIGRELIAVGESNNLLVVE